jgi:amidase
MLSASQGGFIDVSNEVAYRFHQRSFSGVPMVHKAVVATVLPLVFAAAGCGDDSSSSVGSSTGPDAGLDAAPDALADAAPEGGDASSEAAEIDPQTYLDRSMSEQVEAMEAGGLSSVALTAAYLTRIEQQDRGADGINAVLSLDPSAQDLAAQADLHRGGGALLQGAVILLKDNIDTAGLATTAGSLAMADNVPEDDAPLVRKLRDAGAVILGKTNLSEWANARGMKSTSGWSSLGGQTRNGAVPGYNPCGSSSGSAASVAAGFASAAIGTETDGSIVCPASVHGVVGFKPTVGLVSRTGIIPISHTQDTAGPMTKNVRDAARLLTVMAGPDPKDPASDEIPDGLDLDFEAGLAGASFEGLRLGVVDNLMGYHTALDVLFEEQVAKMETAGATVVHVSLPPVSAYASAEMTVILHELKHDLNAYLAVHPIPGQPSTLAELIAFNDAHAAEVMPYFGQEIFLHAEATTGLAAQAYLDAKEIVPRVIGEEGIDSVMTSNDLDALIAPTGGPAWRTNYATGDQFLGGASPPAAVSGGPHLTVPMGEVVDLQAGFVRLPVGLSVFAGRWQDASVLAIGQAFEALREAE